MSNQVNYYQTNASITINPVDEDIYQQSDPFVTLNSPNKNLPFPDSLMIVLQPRKVNFQPTTLGNTVHIYSSPMYQDIINLATYFGDWSCSYEIQEGPVHTITVQVPWDTISQEDFSISDFASEQWELVPNTEQKDLIYTGLISNPFLAPSVDGNYVVLPDGFKVAVTRALENKSVFISSPASGSSIPSGSIASFIPWAQQFLAYLRFGVTGVPSYTQTLKRTAVIDTRNSNNAFNTAADNEQKTINANGALNYLLSTPDLVNKYVVPADTVAKFMLPSYYKFVSNAYDSHYCAVYAGWLVKPPSFQFITRNKVQLSQEFVWNEWLGGLYYINSNVEDFPFAYSPAANPNGVFAP